MVRLVDESAQKVSIYFKGVRIVVLYTLGRQNKFDRAVLNRNEKLRRYGFNNMDRTIL